MWKILDVIPIFRKYFVVIFTLSFYMLSIYYFFFNNKILLAFLFAIFFFLFAHFFMIELKKIDITNLLLIVIVSSVFELFWVWFDNFFYVIWVLLFNISVFYLFWDIYEEIYNRIQISSYKVFTMWIKMYSLTLSLVFAVVFLWTYRTFNLTCNDIYSWMKKISNYALQDFWLKIPDVQNTKLSDVIPHITPNANMSTWNTNIKLSSVLSISFWKNAVINQILDNKKILDKNICSIIVWQIKEKYNKPWFQFAVMFLMFLLFYPFVRLILYILAILNLIMFKIMNLLKIYRFKKEVEDVEIIE